MLTLIGWLTALGLLLLLAETREENRRLRRELDLIAQRDGDMISDTFAPHHDGAPMSGAS